MNLIERAPCWVQLKQDTDGLTMAEKKYYRFSLLHTSCRFVISSNAKQDKVHRCLHFAGLQTLKVQISEYSWKNQTEIKTKTAQKFLEFSLFSATVINMSFGVWSHWLSTTFPNQNKARNNLLPNTSNFLTEKISPPEPAFHASNKSWKQLAKVVSSFPKGVTVRRPHASNNTDLFPGGFLTAKLSKLTPCSRGDALLLGGSLLTGARTVLLEGRTGCDVVRHLMMLKELENLNFNVLTVCVRLSNSSADFL